MEGGTEARRKGEGNDILIGCEAGNFGDSKFDVVLTLETLQTDAERDNWDI